MTSAASTGPARNISLNQPSSDGKRAAGFDHLHRELRVDAGETGQLGELVHIERLVRGLVSHRDEYDVVGQPKHAAALDNLVEGGDSRLEGLNGGPVLEGELDVHGDLEPSADRGWIDVRVVTPDDAGLLKRPDAAKARGGRKPNLLSELDVRQPPVDLKATQNCAIYGVH